WNSRISAPHFLQIAHSRVLSTVMTIARPPGLGVEDADFGQIQGNFNLRRHRFDPPLWFRGAEACHSSTVVKRPQNVGALTRVPKEPLFQAYLNSENSLPS